MRVHYNTLLKSREFLGYVVSMTILKTGTLVAAKSSRRTA
jgi:hypothetical protein